MSQLRAPTDRTEVLPGGKRPALFCDRDGTLIRDAHFLRSPAQVELLPGATSGLRAFSDAGWALVVVTNQSGIGRGLFAEADYESVREHLDSLLAAEGIQLDASFHCPHHPEHTGACECRKPGTLLFERAREALGIDLAASVFVGDRWRDIAPASVFGGRGILVPGSHTPSEDRDRAEEGMEVATSLPEVARRVLGRRSRDASRPAG